MKTHRKILSTALLCAVMPVVSSPAETIVVDGSTTVGPIAKAFAEYLMRHHPGLQITVSESGSGNGAKSLINGVCHVATMSRPMKSKELRAAKANGIEPVEHIIAMDGLPVLVHPSNPIKNLTVAQVRDIYFGRINNWKWLGGPNLKIVRISRDTNSGTYECFSELVMGGTRMASDVEYVGSNGAVRQRVQSTPAAIGYAGLGFVDKTVKAVAIGGVLPSAETVLGKSYPLSRPLFMYTNGKPADGSMLQKFVEFCKTPEGREIIQTIGFVPLN